jgi:hypothetical protein
MPRESFSCHEAQSALAEIKSLRTDFEQTFQDALKTNDFARAKEIRSAMQGKITSLREAVFPLERELGIKSQYESQRGIFEEAFVLERLSSGEMGIHGIDGKEYPVPSYREIAQRMREKREVFVQKKEQGFTKLLVVPFGMSLENLTQEYANLLVKHYNEGKLFAEKQNAADPDVLLELSVGEPVWRWSDYANADVDGKLVYELKEYSQNHGGLTKTEILANRKPGMVPAWHVLMVEASPNIPRENAGKDVGTRKQLEANQTPNDYLGGIGKGIYDHESGMTPEDWLAFAITNLQEQNQAIDDDVAAYNTGAYFPASDRVPYAFWNRGVQQARLDGNDPTNRYGSIGARSAVRVY